MKNTKGHKANFVWACKCRPQKQHSASFESPPKPYSLENGEFAPFLTMDCRGLEFVGFNPKVGLSILVTVMHKSISSFDKGKWKCYGRETGTEFLIDDVDLGQEDWAGYDEKSGLDVMVSDVKGQWARA